MLKFRSLLFNVVMIGIVSSLMLFATLSHASNVIRPPVLDYVYQQTNTPIALVTNTPTTVESMVLPPGNWEVRALVAIDAAATTSISEYRGGLSAVTNTFSPFYGVQSVFPAFVPAVAGNDFVFLVASVGSTSAVPVTVYCIVQATFTVSTLTADCAILATRTR